MGGWGNFKFEISDFRGEPTPVPSQEGNRICKAGGLRIWRVFGVGVRCGQGTAAVPGDGRRVVLGAGGESDKTFNVQLPTFNVQFQKGGGNLLTQRWRGGKAEVEGG